MSLGSAADLLLADLDVHQRRLWLSRRLFSEALCNERAEAGPDLYCGGELAVVGQKLLGSELRAAKGIDGGRKPGAIFGIGCGVGRTAAGSSKYLISADIPGMNGGAEGIEPLTFALRI